MYPWVRRKLLPRVFHQVNDDSFLFIVCLDYRDSVQEFEWAAYSKSIDRTQHRPTAFEIGNESGTENAVSSCQCGCLWGEARQMPSRLTHSFMMDHIIRHRVWKNAVGTFSSDVASCHDFLIICVVDSTWVYSEHGLQSAQSMIPVVGGFQARLGLEKSFETKDQVRNSMPMPTSLWVCSSQILPPERSLFIGCMLGPTGYVQYVLVLLSTLLSLDCSEVAWDRHPRAFYGGDDQRSRCVISRFLWIHSFASLMDTEPVSNTTNGRYLLSRNPSWNRFFC